MDTVTKKPPPCRRVCVCGYVAVARTEHTVTHTLEDHVEFVFTHRALRVVASPAPNSGRIPSNGDQ
jgi:hypothetical protein